MMMVAAERQQGKGRRIRRADGPTGHTQHSERKDFYSHRDNPVEVRGSAPMDTILMAVTAPHAPRTYHAIAGAAGEKRGLSWFVDGALDAEKAQWFCLVQ